VVAGEALAADHSAAREHSRDGMKMTGNDRLFAMRRRLMPESNVADSDLIAETPADTDRRIGIMVTCNPYPVAAALQRQQRPPVIVDQAAGPVAVMKII